MEIKKNFVGGAMNKDLDERLVPQGYYRDAQNVEIITSEGSNVGSVQNVLGNQERKNQTVNTQWSTYINNLDGGANARCVGSIADTENNKLYWFISIPNYRNSLYITYSIIAEYNTETNLVQPVLVDKKQILRFQEQYLITGINIIDGMMFFTDDEHEPKKINIQQCIDGTADFNTHTQINGEDFKEEHVTVIKKSPLTAPTLAMTSSARAKTIGIVGNPIYITHDFSIEEPAGSGNYELTKINDNVTITIQVSPEAWVRGDIIKITTTRDIDNIRRDLNVRGVITSIDKIPSSEDNYEVSIRLVSIDSRIPLNTSITYACTLEQDDSLYKLKFVRFGYRYKYKDNEYSCFSPFSETAFKPGKYDYRPVIGHNKGMENTIRELTLNFPDLVSGFPNNVNSVDILYKESDNNNVRIVSTIKEGSTYTLTRELLKSLVESSQLLRPFDAVPRYAKAQELIGNRIVYGNYVESYDVDTDPNIDCTQDSSDTIEKQSFTSNGTQTLFFLSSSNFTEFPSQSQDVDILVANKILPVLDFPRVLDIDSQGRTFVLFDPIAPTAGNMEIRFDKRNLGRKSVKSMRTYQLGVVYQDTYGRQSPVFTSQKASTFVPKDSAKKTNRLVGNITTTPPGWATHYKWFVKEGASEYYNLILDTFFEAEDGNIWLAFPSSEINKVSAGDYIELKKQHANDFPVDSNAKFKILDLQTTTPPYLEYTNVFKKAGEFIVINTANYSEVRASFVPGEKRVRLQALENTNVDEIEKALTDGEVSVEFSNAEYKSKSYKITNGFLGARNTRKNKASIELELAQPLVAEDEWLNSLASGSKLNLKISAQEPRERAQLDGRFFAKILRNDLFEQFIERTSPLQQSAYKTDGAILNIAGQVTESQYRNSTAPITTWELLGNNSTNQTMNAANPFAIDATNYKYGNTHPYKNKGFFALTFTGFSVEGTFLNSSSGERLDDDAIEGAINSLNFLPDYKRIKEGALIRFANDTFTSVVYRIIRHPKSLDGFQNYYNIDSWKNAASGPWFTREWALETLDGEPFADNFELDDAGGGNPITRIDIVSLSVNQDNENTRVDNAAVFETEPKEIAELDVYHEASDAIAILNDEQEGQFGNSANQAYVLRSTSGTQSFTTDAPKVINVDRAKNTVTLNVIVNDISTLDVLTFAQLSTGYTTTVKVSKHKVVEFSGSNTIIHVEEGGHVGFDRLSWFNCFSFANGVESNRIRDDFNQVFMDKGPKVSTILEQQFKEERKKASLIYSGVYLNKKSINNSNQFLIAEKITKNLNPEYGSIQKLEARDSNLISCNEDKIINIVANKDAIFNADGNPQLIASTNVLGQAVPYVGEYGISKNPESFVSYAYRSYFTDKARGTVLRLSRDGLTDIGSKGMGDFFGDELPTSTALIGSYNDNKDEYVLTLHKTGYWSTNGATNLSAGVYTPEEKTVAFSEDAGEGGGWTSFKSFIQENGLSINDTYYTFKTGLLYSHDNETRNTFYGAAAVDSSINVLFNEASDMVKSFKTLAYEGSKQRRYRYLGAAGTPEVTYAAADNLTLARLIELTPTETQLNALTAEERQAGWYLDSITTDLQTGGIQEFIGKENKFYNHLRGDTTTKTNLDASEYSVQGLGTIAEVSDPGQSKGGVNITILGLKDNSIKITGTPTGYTAGTATAGELNNVFVKEVNVGDAISSVAITMQLDSTDNRYLPETMTISGDANITTYTPSGPTDTQQNLTLTLNTAGNITTAGLDVTITITASGNELVKSSQHEWYVQGSRLNVLDEPFGVGVKKYFSTSSENGAEAQIATNVTIQAEAGFAFGEWRNGQFVNKDPVLDVVRQNDSTGSYRFEVTERRFNAANNLVQCDFNIFYTFGEKGSLEYYDENNKVVVDLLRVLVNVNTADSFNKTDDPKIRGIVVENFDARRIGILQEGESMEKGYFLDESEVPYEVSKRYLKVFGDVGAKFGISRGSNATSIGVKLNGNASNITSDSLEIPSTGTKGYKRVEVNLPSRENKKYLDAYQFTLTGSDLMSTIPTLSSGSHHAEIVQHGTSKIILKWNNSDGNSNWAGTGGALAAGNGNIFADDNLDYFNEAADPYNSVGVAAATGITRTAQTFHIPKDSKTNPQKYIPFKYEFDNSSTTLTKSRDVVASDFVADPVDKDGASYEISDLTTTVSGTKLTVTGLLTINSYGDGTQSEAGGTAALEIELGNLDELVTGPSSSTASFAVLLYDCTSLFPIGTHKYIHPTTVCSGGSTATGACTFSGLTGKFIRLRDIGVGCGGTEIVGQITGSSTLSPTAYASGSTHYATLSDACGSINGTTC